MFQKCLGSVLEVFSSRCLKRIVLTPESLKVWLVSNLTHLCEYIPVYTLLLDSRLAPNVVRRPFG